MRIATTVEEGAIYRRQTIARVLRKVREGKYLTT
jgi:predicted PP-loop superfamily ATPase